MAGPLSLEAVLRDLARQKICCGILTTANDTVLVWLARNGQLVEGNIVLSTFADRRDRIRFRTAYADPESGITTGPPLPTWPFAVGPVKYTGHAAIAADIANFKAALAANGAREGFMTSIGPASCARVGNHHYKSDD